MTDPVLPTEAETLLVMGRHKLASMEAETKRADEQAQADAAAVRSAHWLALVAVARNVVLLSWGTILLCIGLALLGLVLSYRLSMHDQHIVDLAKRQRELSGKVRRIEQQRQRLRP